jgi:hypothetical protein
MSHNADEPLDGKSAAELLEIALHYEAMIDGMRDRVSAINDRIQALSDEYDVPLVSEQES